MEENNIILIPTHNEGDYQIDNWKLDPKYRPIRLTLQRIKEAGFKGKVFVVNDGSTDNTAKLAEEGGAQVINLEKRRGKAAAVFYGLKQIVSLNPTSVILFDADMLIIKKRDIDRMLELANNATREGRIVQGISSVKEVEVHHPSVETSGIRCFSRKALIELIRAKKTFVRGYQLEDFLNRFFKDHTTKIFHTELTAHIPMRTPVSKKYQHPEGTTVPKNRKIKPAGHGKRG